jgi:hypothetical protein
MSNDINLKEYWKKQKVETLHPSEVIKKASNYKKKVLLKVILANVTLISTSVFIGFIWHYYQPEFLTTKIGIIICIVDMVLFLIFHNTLTPLLIKKRGQLSVKDELHKLKKLKKKQHYQQTTLLSIYFVLLYLGLGLYMFEYASRMTLFWAIFTYAIILIWVCFNAFYFRPKIVKRNEHKLKTLIAQLNKIEQQFYEK